MVVKAINILFATEDKYFNYSAKIAVLGITAWFIVLIDSTILNVPLPKIAVYFQTTAIYAEWAIIGFFVAFAATISVSNYLAHRFTAKYVFIFGQVFYLLSSIGCGLSWSLSSLIFFRILQGFFGGLFIPVGGSLLLRKTPKIQWSKYTSQMNLIALITPTLGPVVAGYITTFFGWRYLFFLKIPLQIICLMLSIFWVRKKLLKKISCDWIGLILGLFFFSSLLYGISILGESKESLHTGLVMLFGACILLWIFFRHAKKTKFPLIPVFFLRRSMLLVGLILQSLANVIFLGIFFIMAFFFQNALQKSVIVTGWILSAATFGLLMAELTIARCCPRISYKSFIILGFAIMTLLLIAFSIVDENTTAWGLALITFMLGLANGFIQSADISIVSEVLTQRHHNAFSQLRDLFKQLTGSFGVALSTMTFTICLTLIGISNLESIHFIAVAKAFKIAFAFLGVIPLIGLIVASVYLRPQFIVLIDD